MASASKVAESQQIVVGIDLLRALAATLVMIFHFGYAQLQKDIIFFGQPLTHETNFQSWFSFTWWGWIGVQIFFVISGLVLARGAATYEGRAVLFLKNRFLRLVPVVLISVCFAAFIELFFVQAPINEILARTLRTIIFFPNGPWIMSQFWTISIEISFYALIFCLILIRSTNLLKALAVVLIIMSLVFWGAWFALGDDVVGFGRPSAVLLLQHGMYFGMGILIARLEWQIGSWLTWSMFAAGLVASVLQIKVVAGWHGNAAGLENSWSFVFIAFAVGFTLILASIQVNDWVLKRLSGHQLSRLRTIGLMTYPVYLIHYHIGATVFGLGMYLGLPFALLFFAAMGVSFYAAWFVTVRIEPYVFRFLAHWIDRAFGNRKGALGKL